MARGCSAGGAQHGRSSERADQCQYGLQVKGIPNKKPTDFMVNGEHMASMLSRRCSGGHEHQPLMEGRAALAQHYPRRLCQAMVKGAEKDSIAWRWCSWATEEGQDENGEKDLEEELHHVNSNGVTSLKSPRKTCRPCSAWSLCSFTLWAMELLLDIVHHLTSSSCHPQSTTELFSPRMAQVLLDPQASAPHHLALLHLCGVRTLPALEMLPLAHTPHLLSWSQSPRESSSP